MARGAVCGSPALVLSPFSSSHQLRLRNVRPPRAAVLALPVVRGAVALIAVLRAFPVLRAVTLEVIRQVPQAVLPTSTVRADRSRIARTLTFPAGKLPTLRVCVDHHHRQPHPTLTCESLTRTQYARSASQTPGCKPTFRSPRREVSSRFCAKSGTGSACSGRGARIHSLAFRSMVIPPDCGLSISDPIRKA